MNKIEKINKIINSLNPDNIYELYFIYDICFYNIWHNTLFLTTKLLGLLNRRKGVEHCCHIGRFYKDGKLQKAKVFEGVNEYGMIENDLNEKLKSFKGKVYIRALGKVDKKKAKEFELKYKGLPYSKNGALWAGLDFKLIDKIFKQEKGRFCSWLLTKFLKDQGQKLSKKYQDENENTPADLYYRDNNIKLFLDL